MSASYRKRIGAGAVPVRAHTVLILLASAWFQANAGATEVFSPPLRNAAPGENRFLVRPRDGAAQEGLERFHLLAGCEVVRRFPNLGGTEVLRVLPGKQTEGILQQYQHSGLFEFAEPDFRVQLANVFPNDPSFLDGTLWALNNAGQDGGAPNADIDAPEAWRVRTSASNVVVAVIDTGARYTHEDLAGNMWTHPNDGSHGFNALNGSSDPNDDDGHGTRIAGIIGAVGNNGVGTVGIAWRVQIMACKFAGQSGGSVSDALACLDYARTNGARIINASWGLDEFSVALSNSIHALRAAGILVVAAAGNSGRDIDVVARYPASYNLDNIIAVTATTRRDELYPLSNLGPTNVDLAAPGDEIYSTDSQSDTSYALDFGTSMATAYVTGAAALLRVANPGETPAQIISRILDSVDPLPFLNGNCVSGGRLNLRKALGVPVSHPLLSATVLNHELTLLLVGDPGKSYVIEKAANPLAPWSEFSTNLTSLTGAFILTNVLTGQPPSQFYRARLTAP